MSLSSAVCRLPVHQRSSPRPAPRSTVIARASQRDDHTCDRRAVAASVIAGARHLFFRKLYAPRCSSLSLTPAEQQEGPFFTTLTFLAGISLLLGSQSAEAKPKMTPATASSSGYNMVGKPSARSTRFPSISFADATAPGSPCT